VKARPAIFVVAIALAVIALMWPRRRGSRPETWEPVPFE
jgi:hypothetical protein